MQHLFLHKLSFLLLALLLNWVAPYYAIADELKNLGFTDDGNVQMVTTARIPRPISQVAENVTVVTAEDIARLNAHTLSDVLQTIPGIQLDYLRTPSTFTFFNIQGASSTTVLVLIDGIRQNDFDQNMATPGQIPVQMIDRIEITKGPASSVYGSALGGVVNIITKSPDPDRKVLGMVSGSIGERFTADSRAELSGTLDHFGYYLNAGNLRSDGFSANTAANQNNLYGKFSYLLPSEGKVTFGLSQLNSHPGLDEGNTPAWGFVHDSNRYMRTYGFLNFYQPLTRNLSLGVDGYATRREDNTMYGGRDNLGADYFYMNGQIRDNTRGANTRLTWEDGRNSLVTGVEYGHVWAQNEDVLSSNPPVYDRAWESWAFYSGGAYSIGQLTLLPGIRYDSTGICGSYTSYTMGLTYKLTGNTTLRTYAGQGFSLPQAQFLDDNELQKIKTIQGGVESSGVPYLWLKGTYFYNTVRNSSAQSNTVNTITNQDRQGFEVEARTVPMFGLSLGSGYTYQHVKNADTGEELQTDSNQSVPSHLVKLALKYDITDLGLRSTLTGNYVFWNSAPGYPVSDKGMIWDLHLNWKVSPKNELSPELFFSGHNLFNGDQTTFTVLYKSVPRWFEGGVRLRF